MRPSVQILLLIFVFFFNKKYYKIQEWLNLSPHFGTCLGRRSCGIQKRFRFLRDFIKRERPFRGSEEIVSSTNCDGHSCRPCTALDGPCSGRAQGHEEQQDLGLFVSAGSPDGRVRGPVLDGARTWFEEGCPVLPRVLEGVLPLLALPLLSHPCSPASIAFMATTCNLPGILIVALDPRCIRSWPKKEFGGHAHWNMPGRISKFLYPMWHCLPRQTGV